MADESNVQDAGQVQQGTQEAEGAEERNETPDVAADGSDGGDDVRDSHGQPGINKERHDREVNALNERIRDLEAQVAEASESKKAREDMQSRISELKAELDAERNTSKLERAGCVDAETALLLLERYGGDVAKLKEAKPFLFEQKRGATGLQPTSGPSDAESERRMARKAAGLPVNDKE